jgi:hypothetical protein
MSFLIDHCHKIIQAYHDGKLGYMKMPEDEHPDFTMMTREQRLSYFTLPMALNYQRNSYTLRESVLKTYNNTETRDVFDITICGQISEEDLRTKLLKYKVALQPNKHIQTRHKIVKTITTNRWGLLQLLEAVDYDFLQLQKIIQKDYKSGFPYLSWPKIFHYRAMVIQSYGWIELKNKQYIDIAPDTHITQCSVRLWVITAEESISLSKEAISDRWRILLDGSGIVPSDMHAPLRFRSRNGFQFEL